jgi:hypothetical protein
MTCAQGPYTQIRQLRAGVQKSQRTRVFCRYVFDDVPLAECRRLIETTTETETDTETETETEVPTTTTAATATTTAEAQYRARLAQSGFFSRRPEKRRQPLLPR